MRLKHLMGLRAWQVRRGICDRSKSQTEIDRIINTSKTAMVVQKKYMKGEYYYRIKHLKVWTRVKARKCLISAVRPISPKGAGEAMDIDSGRAIRKWKAREDQHLGGIEVLSHGAHDTGNLRRMVSRQIERGMKLNTDLHL